MNTCVAAVPKIQVWACISQQITPDPTMFAASVNAKATEYIYLIMDFWIH